MEIFHRTDPPKRTHLEFSVVPRVVLGIDATPKREVSPPRTVESPSFTTVDYFGEYFWSVFSTKGQSRRGKSTNPCFSFDYSWAQLFLAH